MDVKHCKIVATNSRNLAENYLKLKYFGRAFSHYLIALKLNPSWKTELKRIFSLVLCEWGSSLENKGKFDDLFKCYEQAIEVFPDNEYILNNLGAHLLKYGLINEAAHYFRKSLDIQPYFLQAFRNLKSISNLVVPRWHFRMLNDYKRNRAFREAIIKKIKKGYDSVLDIGTGTGILSLFALEAGANRITACDTSSFMIEVANQVIEDNNSCSIHLLSKHSFDVMVPQDIPERVSLVVTEIVDCGLLGEHVLETLIDAWERLLLPPATDSNSQATTGVVIPSGAFIFVTGIECDNISKTYFLTESIKKYFNFENCMIQYNEENYDCKNLKAMCDGCKFVTDTYKTLFINFNDPESLKKFFSGDRDTNIILKCSESGRMDSLVVWFDLYLDDEIILSTAPHSDSNDSWDQAIFPLPNNLTINKYDEISVNMSFRNGKVSFHDFSLKSFKINSVYDNSEVFHPTKEVMSILNNTSYQKSFLQIIKLVCNKFKMKNVCILDTFPFPFFGFKYLLEKRSSKHVVFSVVQSEEDRRFIRFIAKKYNVENQITFMTEEEFLKLDETNKFDIILLNFFEGNGELKDELISHFDNIISLLKSDGLLLPEKITVIGQFIESEWLDKMSKVINDDVTFGYRISKYLNIYQVNSHIDFDLMSIPKISRSEPFELFEVTSGQFISKLIIPIISVGMVNAMAYWFRINFITGCTEISTLEDTVIKQCALLFPSKFASSALEFTIIYDNGLFKIEIHNQSEGNNFSKN